MRSAFSFLVVVLVLAMGLPAAAQSDPLTFVVSRSGSTYSAQSQTTSSSYSGSLKDAVESAVDELDARGGGTVIFTEGDFDLGLDWFEFIDVTDVVFQGQGIDVTTIRNNATADTDTEPFDMTRSDYITIRDMTVHADGPPRNTSDAIDFDGGDYVLIERVKVTGARGRGIIFDGKDSGQTSTNNVIRDCIVTGVPLDGIQLLAASNNRIENCLITDVGAMGIKLTKSSTIAAQPNKKPNDNVVVGNTVDRTGSYGIGVRAGDRNLVSGNTVTNAQNGNSGILIAEAGGIYADDNVVQFNTATDTQVPKTQGYGLNIAHPTCRRTVVIDNDFEGNRDGEIRDRGTDTIYTSADQTAPTAPSNLAATQVTGVRVDLTWGASQDNIAVAGYDIVRNGQPLTSVSGSLTSYADTTVAPDTAYIYVVFARDPAGNVSEPSNSLDVTTSPPPPVVVQGPTDDASLRPGKGALGSATTLEVDAESVKDSALRFDVNAVGGSAVVRATLRLYAVDGSSSGGTFVQMTNTSWDEETITWENAPPGDGIELGTLGAVGAGNWYEVDVTPLVRGNGPVAIRISSTNTNGADYASTEGTPEQAPQLVIELDEAPPADEESPTAPANLQATDVQASSVAVQWDAATDNVSVVAYDIYRDEQPLDSISGSTTTYTDTTVAADTAYTYVVVARDQAGNTSGPSNLLEVTTPGQPAVYTLGASDDATVRENRPDRNLGDDEALEVDASSRKDTLLRFDVSGVGASTVQRATLRMHVLDGSSSGGEWTSTSTTSWSEGTVTWNTAPAADGVAVGSIGEVAVGTWVELDVTSLVTGDGAISLRGSSLNPNGADYASKDGPADLAPQLVIELGGGGSAT